MSEASALIQLQNVSKIFYTDEVETHALDGIDLSICPGEYVAISGPSGCGKSTLLSILGLLDSPTAGDYTLNGHPVAQLSQADRAWTRNREVGFIFQSFNLIGDLTVYENVELPLTYRGMQRAERRERVTEALEKVEMAHRAKTEETVVNTLAGVRLAYWDLVYARAAVGVQRQALALAEQLVRGATPVAGASRRDAAHQRAGIERAHRRGHVR